MAASNPRLLAAGAPIRLLPAPHPQDEAFVKTVHGRGDSLCPPATRLRLVHCVAAEPPLSVTVGHQPPMRIAAGDLFLLPANTSLAISGSGLHRFNLVRIDPALSPDQGQLPALLKGSFRDAWLLGLLDRLWRELDGLPVAGSDSDYTRAAAVVIAAELLHTSGRVAGRKTGGLAPWQLRRIQTHATQRLMTRLTLSELAGIVDLSVYHFSRAFKQSTGVTPHRWLQAQRIERAKAMLAAGTRVIDAGIAVGYDSPGHFAQVFRRFTGMSPRSYRRLSADNP